MKTEINAKGKLTISPETELEAYALIQWASTYFKEVDPCENGFSILRINNTNGKRIEPDVT